MNRKTSPLWKFRRCSAVYALYSVISEILFCFILVFIYRFWQIIFVTPTANAYRYEWHVSLWNKTSELYSRHYLEGTLKTKIPLLSFIFLYTQFEKHSFLYSVFLFILSKLLILFCTVFLHSVSQLSQLVVAFSPEGSDSNPGHCIWYFYVDDLKGDRIFTENFDLPPSIIIPPKPHIH